MKKMNMFSCYDWNNGFLLIEAVINLKPDKIKFHNFYVLNKENRDVPTGKLYAIQFLEPDGLKRTCELFERPRPIKPCRIAFFVVKHAGDFLTTPYGTFDLSEPEPLPDRLINCIEFIGMADRDKYNYYFDEEL